MTTGHPKPSPTGDAPRPEPTSWSVVVRRGVVQEVDTVLARFGIVPGTPVPGMEAVSDAARARSPAPIDIEEIMAASVRRTGCAHFGLLVGRGDILAAHALAGCLIPGARTVGDALVNLVGHLRTHVGAAAPSLNVEGPVAHLGYAIPGPSTDGADQLADVAAALALNVLRTLCGADWSAMEVTLPRSNPADPTPFTRYFRSPIRFGAGTATVAFPAETLDRPVEAADLLRAVFAAHPVPYGSRARGGFSDDVRRVLRARLMVQDCSAKTVAASFSMHRRTFNRHLHAEGSSFNGMVNEVRFEISRRLITDSGMSLGQIAAALCFSEPSAFTRAFRRWSGQSPTAWRADHPVS